jgi:hypothetical protein
MEDDMSNRELEARVQVLEVELDALRQEVRRAQPAPSKDWRAAVEKYAGDEDLQAVFAKALEQREADRKRARKPVTKRPKKQK